LAAEISGMKSPAQSAPPTVGLPPEQFAAAFPFHFVAAADLKILQAGRALQRICPDVQIGAALGRLFHARQPEGELTADWIRQNRNRFFLLEHIASRLQLRGEFLSLPGAGEIVFLGSPWLAEVAEIAEWGLAFDDFAIHDPVVDMLQIQQLNRLALADMKKLNERLTEQRAELRAANERLRRQEADTRMLAIIAERTDNSVVLTDAAGKILWVNAGFTRMTGYALAEIAGKTPGSVLQGPETSLETVRHMHSQLAKGEGFQVELVNYAKDGRKYWLASEVQPIRDESGQVTNFMAIQIDITRRKNAEHRLLETSALQRAMLEGAGYAIIAADTRGTIRLFNPAAERLLGYTAAEMIGKLTPEIFHDRDEVVTRARELSLELGREVKPGFDAFVAKAELGQPDQREWTYVHKDGWRFPVLLSVTALFDHQQKITGYLGVATDLTERKRDEQKVRATLTELERMNRVMMNREERVLELKTEINQMCLATGLPPAYPAVLEADEKPPLNN
jgi:two-component system, sensor histidine kinase and response regulator